MGVKLGLDAKLYRNAGTYEAPDWEEVENVRDLTLNVEGGEADVTTRANGGWKAVVPTLKEGSIEFEMVWDTEDEDFEAIRTAYFARSSIEFAVMDDEIAVAGSQGLRATMAITKFNREEKLDDALKASVTAKPTLAAHAPSWMTVPGGGVAATGTISVGGLPSDGDTIVLGDGRHPAVTFEFDDDEDTTAGNVPVTIGESADATMAALVVAINSAVPLGVTATASTPPDNACTLANDTAGAAGNVAIVKDGANITVTGMSGGVG